MKESIQSKGGKARAKNMTAEQRRQSAIHAANARWPKRLAVDTGDLLEQLLKELFESGFPREDTDAGEWLNANCPQVMAWWKSHLQTLRDQKEMLKKQALLKLTQEERDALGV